MKNTKKMEKIEQKLDEIARGLIAVANMKTKENEKLEKKINKIDEMVRTLIKKYESDQEKQKNNSNQNINNNNNNINENIISENPNEKKNKKPFSFSTLITRITIIVIIIAGILFALETNMPEEKEENSEQSSSEIIEKGEAAKLKAEKNMKIKTVKTISVPAPENNSLTLSPINVAKQQPIPFISPVLNPVIKNETPKNKKLPKPLILPENFKPEKLAQAAINNNKVALFEIGLRYLNGENINKNEKQAAQWFIKSAQQNFPPAQYAIAGLLENGIGIKKNIKTAKYWYTKAARHGNVNAMYNLAVILATGGASSGDNSEDKNKNKTSDNDQQQNTQPEKAVAWFTKAADLNMKNSQFNLAIMYLKGEGTPQSLTHAYKWFAIASEHGDKDAQTKMKMIQKNMAKDEMEFARDLIESWRPKKPLVFANKAKIPQEWKIANNINNNNNTQEVLKNIPIPRKRFALHTKKLEVQNTQ